MIFRKASIFLNKKVFFRFKKHTIQKIEIFPTYNKTIIGIFALFLSFQLVFPWRYVCYPGKLYWTEEGYRFSWRVMLMEKNGDTSIVLKDPKTGRRKEVNQKEYLTDFQRQQMRTQPDMILQFCNYIGDDFKNKNGYNPEIYVKSRISLNGKRSKPFTDYAIDVYNAPSNILETLWILPYH